MNLRHPILVGSFLVGIWPVTENAWAQLPDEATRIYTLISGSHLTVGCRICDQTPIVVSMTGTFRLRFLDQNPILSRYQIQDISFHRETNGGAAFSVSGSGAYQIGGEVGVFQDAFLDVQIDNGTTKTSALCVNGDRSVTQAWPEIQSPVYQTNGTSRPTR